MQSELENLSTNPGDAGHGVPEGPCVAFESDHACASSGRDTRAHKSVTKLELGGTWRSAMSGYLLNVQPFEVPKRPLDEIHHGATARLLQD